ncbi:MAG: asparagine synthase (glutamine-hydrolyzing) [Acidobacteria bacterium]|jgi:asparagine synthase (glutamine-hydrolysing)|nr:asparagine synthase (glutamine-hydrolyzing) [Acidobacteriota bacterium]
MCGICGIVRFDGNPVRENSIRLMMRSIKHRGPDDEGLFLDTHTGLGFVRLSIIDLSPAGCQPMVSDDNRYVIVYNGEIYNYIELRDQLKGKYNFKTRTDTEVLLNAYREWGQECLHRLNGMFAFVIYDKKTGDIFAARDRFGIKPFYYYFDQHSFIFASEQRAILPFLKNRVPNNKAIYEFLVYNRTDQGDYTFFQGMQKLAHGSWAKLKNGVLETKKWYVLQEQIKKPFYSPGEFYEMFKDSIKLQLRSDVPVGVCLSGGLDSSSIVSVILKEFNKPGIDTFSAVYKKSDGEDESTFINEYHDALENMHFTTPSADSLFADLESFIDCHSEPVPTLGSYALFKVMQAAKNHVSVTLDGQGADEQLAGYHYFFASYFKDLLKCGRFSCLANEMAAYIKMHRSLLAVKYLGLYLTPSFLKDTLSRLTHNYVTNDFFHNTKEFSNIRNELYNPDTLTQSLFQHFEYKLEHLLKWEDHNSMWFSIEARVPFLDHHLVERTLALPPGQILKKGCTKYILREAMKGVLPEKIRTRTDKIGFGIPWESWFKNAKISEFTRDVLHSPAFKNRGILDQRKCLKNFELFIRGKISIPKETWKWLNLELWFREFIDINTKKTKLRGNDLK